MTRRWEAPRALAEQWGREKRGPRSQAQTRKTRPAIGSTFRGSSNGRTPRLTPEEMSVRIRRPEPANHWTDVVGATPVRTTTPGLDPEAMIEFLNIVASGRSLNMTDWTRHEGNVLIPTEVSKFVVLGVLIASSKN